MKKIIKFAIIAIITATAESPCHAAKLHNDVSVNDANDNETTLRTNIDRLALIVDGRELDGGWNVLYGDETDEFQTSASEVIFASDCDTLRIKPATWERVDFTIVSGDGRRAPVRVTRMSKDIFSDPDPLLVKRSESGLLSREQAEFDLQALLYTLSEVHPDIYSVAKQEDLLRAFNKAIASLPDSVSTMELYRLAAPVVAMIGDGHTNLVFPVNDVFTKDLKRMPLWVDVLSDKTIICRASMDSIIPGGAKTLSINGKSVAEILDTMIPYVAGESEAFRLSRVDGTFSALRHMLFPANEFEILYLPEGEEKPRSVKYAATLYDELKARSPQLPGNSGEKKSYSYTVDKANNMAIMDFQSFNNRKRMEAFADSMFRDLREQNIGNLIIDLRRNGGGSSDVGDIVLRYISPEPFLQMDKALIKITPVTRRLMREDTGITGIFFYEISPENYISPRTPEEGHFDGNVYLLTSNKTFSSAGSFAWAFKECGMGTVVGEETGGMNVCYGDILPYRLPISNLQCSISFKRFWQLRADENDIHGALPDVAVPAAKAMDKAMEIITKKQ